MRCPKRECEAALITHPVLGDAGNMCNCDLSSAPTIEELPEAVIRTLNEPPPPSPHYVMPSRRELSAMAAGCSVTMMI